MAPDAPKPLVRRMFALLNEGGVGGTDARPARLAVYEFITWRRLSSTDDLAEIDIRAIVAALEYWKLCGAISYRCRRIADMSLPRGEKATG
jgi:hypothetical protein